MNKSSTATELRCQSTIVEAAKLGGWLVHAERAAQTRKGWRTPVQGSQGFPDLVLVHAERRRVMFVELKRAPNKVTPDQQVWGEQLERAGADYRLVWVPGPQQDELCAELISTQRRPRMTVVFHDPLLYDEAAE
jgi:hypothetical protein